jgi:hypothetical protein
METTNSKIAKFLGWKQQTDPTEKWFGQWFKPNYGWRKENELDFDSDWNSLMAAVIECFDKYSELDNQQSVFNADNQQFKLNDALLLTDIKELYKAVVNFIDWYNEQS